MWPLLVVFVVLIVLLLYYDRRVMSACSNVPGPPTWPFIGNAHECIGDSADFFLIVNKCWDLFGTRARCFIGHRLILLLSDPKDVEVVLGKQEFINKSIEYNFLKPWLGNGLLTSKGDYWRTRRKIITPAFHFKILENFLDVFNSQTDILIEKLKGHVDKEPVDIYPLIAMYTLDVISETAMGVPINAQKFDDSEYVQAVKDMCDIICERNKNPLKRIDYLFNLTKDAQRQKKSLKILHDFTKEMIQKRRKILKEKKETLASYTNLENNETDGLGKKTKMAFLDMLLLSTVNGQPLSDVDIQEEVDTFLFEGHDTTASALSFALYLLASNPDVQQNVYEEQLMLFEDNETIDYTYSKLQEMKYLELVIKETMRLYPSVPMLGRETSHDTKINDIEVPAKTSIVILIYNMHRNPAVFPEPDKFIPERFTPEESSKRHPYSMIAFSAGPRNCIGQKFAMLEMKCALSKIVRTFQLIPSQKQFDLQSDLILKSVNGIFIKFKKR